MNKNLLLYYWPANPMLWFSPNARLAGCFTNTFIHRPAINNSGGQRLAGRVVDKSAHIRLIPDSAGQRTHAGSI
jgi:hypothetical protein